MIASSPRRPRPRRRSFPAALFAAFLLAVGPAAAQTVPAWSADAEKAWWAQNPTPDKWDAAAKSLDAQLAAVYQHSGQSAFSSSDFQGWMELLEWVRLGQADASFLSQDPKHLAAFVALAQDDDVSHLLVQKMEPEDSRTGALEAIVALAEANAADLHEYAALGVAYALVFDVPFPADWPHAQVAQSAVPIGDVDVTKRFAWYVAANRARKLENDLTQLPFDDLKFLVDSEVQLSELDYALSKTEPPYDHFDKAFFQIAYDNGRVSGDLQFNWPGATYTLADIEKNNGICVDQAYYAAMLGKGRGIPTIFFHGLGDEGGHAWFGYLKKDGTWALDCGRYANQNFPKGFAVDPQTWQDIKDTTLEDYVKNVSSNPNYQPARNALDWAWLHPGDDAVARQAYEDARTIMPEYSESWSREGDLLERTHASLDDVKAFYDAWTKQFTGYPDMKVDGQQRLLAALKAANDPEAADVERDITMANRSTGVDLSVQGSFSAIEDKMKAGDWDDAKIGFEAAVRDFSDTGGSTFVYNVVEPYIDGCLDHGRFDQAADGLQFMEDRMTVNGNIMADVMEQLHGEIKLLRPLPDLATAWLQEIDQGNESQAWDDGAPMLKQVAQDQWTDAIKKQRDPLGSCQGRELVLLRRVHGTVTVDGQTTKISVVRVRFRTTFDNNVIANETVYLQRDPDGHYHAAQYEIQRAPTATAGP